MSKETVIEQLATYFTGPTVPFHSIGLGMGGGSAKMANLFFEMRSALGIEGYADKGEAIKTITAKLGE